MPELKTKGTKPPSLGGKIAAMLQERPNIKAEEVIALLRKQGVVVPTSSIRQRIHSVRYDLKKRTVTGVGGPAAAVVSVPMVATSTPTVAAAPAYPDEIDAVLAAVPAVRKLAGELGGLQAVETALGVFEATTPSVARQAVKVIRTLTASQA
jgi:hypothetical protein